MSCTCCFEHIPMSPECPLAASPEDQVPLPKAHVSAGLVLPMAGVSRRGTCLLHSPARGHEAIGRGFEQVLFPPCLTSNQRHLLPALSPRPGRRRRTAE